MFPVFGVVKLTSSLAQLPPHAAYSPHEQITRNQALSTYLPPYPTPGQYGIITPAMKAK
jgi:hypothetical protein